MEKYVVILSMKEVTIFNMIDGGPPARYAFSSGLGVGVGTSGSALVCDDYQIFAFGMTPIERDKYENDGRTQDRDLVELFVLAVLDSFWILDN